MSEPVTFSAALAHAFHRVKQHMGWDDEKTRLWFETKNPFCGGITPAAFILLRPEKAARWIEALIEENSPPVDTPQA